MIAPQAPEFADYLHWFHFANGTLQLAMSRCFYLRRLNLAADNPILLAAEGRRERAFRYVDERLNAVPYLAGDVFTAADIMTAFCSRPCVRSCQSSLRPIRAFSPISSALAVAKRIAEPWKRGTRHSPRCWPDRAPFKAESAREDAPPISRPLVPDAMRRKTGPDPRWWT